MAIDLDAPPARVFAQIEAAGADEFSDLMAEPASREKVIDALVAHMASQFRPENAGDLEAVIHVKLWDRPGGGYEHRERGTFANEVMVVGPVLALTLSILGRMAYGQALHVPTIPQRAAVLRYLRTASGANTARITNVHTNAPQT